MTHGDFWLLIVAYLIVAIIALGFFLTAAEGDETAPGKGTIVMMAILWSALVLMLIGAAMASED
jgi:uncharacterized membrane protein YhaH (DUF805 family)